jgi:hypothetical protein
MPDTLAVTADEAEWSAGLVAGFAEKQTGLFDEEPSTIRTIDRAAEALNADAYRDLLREIDRAFDGFDRSAVRHGWWVDQGSVADVSVGAGTSAALSAIDLPEFVAAAIGRDGVDRGVLRLPAEWCAGLDGLPGFDREQSVLRITRNRARYRDARGRSLGFLGQAHPLVRRACSHAQRLGDGDCDNRVGVAFVDDATPAVLLTFSAEQRSTVRCEFMRIIAVLLPACGSAVEMAKPELWLRLAEAGCAVRGRDVWHELFADWVPGRRQDAEAIASNVMYREAARAAAIRGQSHEAESAQLQAWLRSRADDICGAYKPPTGELFGATATGPDWQWLEAPLDRLAGFAADGSYQPPRRREASSAVALFQTRSAEIVARTSLLPPVLCALGMLMLVPRARAA